MPVVVVREMSAIAHCQHLTEFKKDEIKSFRALHQVFVVCSEHDSKIAKLKNAFCHICKRLSSHLHTCIHCVFFGCHKHIRDHARAKKHCFTMELSYGQLHCIKCNDYVYDAGLDKIAIENTMKAKKCAKRVLNWNAALEVAPDDKHIAPKRVCITPESTRGLRGLVNLGSTCFMNCIVQIFMHTPLLKDYFLSERHKCKGPTGNCIVCELARLFQEFYKGPRVPLAINKLVHMIWIRAKQLAGLQEQDAHDFFIATIDALHQDSQETHHSIPTNKLSKCPCIIDQIFSGLLQSDVVCKLCRGVSTKFDPLWDFSLELGQVTVDGRDCSLLDCLERFTSTEHLDLQENDGFLCSNCDSYQDSTKQLTMKTLPIVICFHLKRFEKNNQKIDAKVVFPEMLDMTPYMSRNKESLYSVIPGDNRYSLFAVVNHFGRVCTGHYIAYVRHQRDLWYQCDDHRISKATIEQVLGSEGYLLFYHKHILGYE